MKRQPDAWIDRVMWVGPALLALSVLLNFAEHAAAAKVKGDAQYAPYTIVELKATEVSSKDAQFIWKVDNKKASVRKLGDTLYLTGPPGSYTVVLTAIDFEKKKVEEAEFSFTIGDAPPPPPPPGPTPPPPGPNPPPIPVPKDDAPIKEPGFRVLIVYETGDVSKLPVAQRLIVTSGTLRDYLRKTCVPDSTANQDGRGYRMWDKDTDVANESKLWQDAFKRPRKGKVDGDENDGYRVTVAGTEVGRYGKLKDAKEKAGDVVPWILVSNGKTGYEGPLPATVEDTLALLKKYELPASKKDGK